MAEACRLELQAVEQAKRAEPREWWERWVQLEGGSKKEIRKALESIAWDEDSLQKVPSVNYLTPVFIQHGHEYHQFLLLGTVGNGPIEGNVLFFEGPKFDVWMSRHREPRKAWMGAGIIVVDKSVNPRKSYLFSALGDPVPKGHLPTFVPNPENCLVCHSNGPRAIRTADPTGLPIAYDSRTRKRIESFNEKMLAYGKVETFMPVTHYLPKLPVHAYEPVQHRACIDCHGDASPLRSPLRRMHVNEILFMLSREPTPGGHIALKAPGSRKALMPMAREPLSDGELQCLTGWLMRDRQPGCNERGEVDQTRSGVSSYSLDATASFLRADAASNFSTIPIEGFRLSGRLRCEGSTCQGEVRADLRALTTGIALRDRHLKEKTLQISEHPFAVAAVGPFPADSEGTVQAEVTFTGKAGAYQAKLRCSRSEDLACKLSDLRVDLVRHGITPPSFLGAKVMPEVQVSGTLIFRESPPERALSSLEN